MNSVLQRIFSFLFFVLVIFNLQAQVQSGIEKGLESITENSLKAQLGFLSSDWFEGREMTTEGAHKAADYLASQFGVFGIEPYFDTSYFQKVDFVVSENSRAEIYYTHKEKGASKTISFTDGIDFKSSLFYINREISGSLVFGFYGFNLDKQKESGNILVRMKGFAASESLLYSEMRGRTINSMKNEAAEVAGFSAVLEIDPDLELTPANETIAAPAEKELTKYSSGIYKKGYDLAEFPRKERIPVIRISVNMANQLFPEWNEALKSEADNRKELPEINGTITINCTVDQELRSCRNVLAVIEGEKKDEIIVVGAHYDHLGKYDGYTWNGADDNGSGTIGVLAIAKAFKEMGIKPKRTVVFAAWTGEERGLFGSSYFVKSHSDPKNIKYYHNYDMIGREENPENPNMNVSYMYTASWQNAEEVVRTANDNFSLGLDIRYSGMKNPAVGSDNASFARVDIPVMWFHTGGHPDYHGPFDHADKINYKKMSAIVKASFIALWNLANE